MGAEPEGKPKQIRSVRLVVTIASLILLPVLYLNVEKLAERLGIDTVVADTISPKQGPSPLLEFALHPAMFAAAAFVFGIAAGIWIDTFLARRERHPPPVGVSPALNARAWGSAGFKQRPTKVDGTAIDVEVVAEPGLRDATAMLVDVRRWENAGWGQASLNNNCPIRLSWLTETNFEPLPILHSHPLILFVVGGKRVGLNLWWTKKGFAAIRDNFDNLPLGKYQFSLRIDAQEGSFPLTLEVDWFGDLNSLVVRSVESQLAAAGRL